MLLIRKAEGKEVHPWELQLKLFCCQRGRKKQTQSSSLKFIWALQPPWITPAITFYLLSCIKWYLDKWLLVHEKDRYVRPCSIWFSNTLLSVWRVKSTNVWTLLKEKVQCLLYFAQQCDSICCVWPFTLLSPRPVNSLVHISNSHPTPDLPNKFHVVLAVR